MSKNRITVLIVALAAVAIVAVVATSGGLKLPSVDLPSIGGSEDTAEPTADASDTSDPVEDDAPAGEEAEKGQKKELELPSNPDDVRGTDSYALTRAPNLRRAMRVLDARRRKVEGVFDLLRVAPGRIDTTIIHPDDRMTTIQVNANRDISFENLIDFPTQPGFRKNGLTARDVPAQKVGRLLRAIDRERNGSAARDVDYVVIDRDIIDQGVDVNAYMRIRTPRPRYWRMEGGRAVAFG